MREKGCKRGILIKIYKYHFAIPHTNTIDLESYIYAYRYDTGKSSTLLFDIPADFSSQNPIPDRARSAWSKIFRSQTYRRPKCLISSR